MNFFRLDDPKNLPDRMYERVAAIYPDLLPDDIVLLAQQGTDLIGIGRLKALNPDSLFFEGIHLFHHDKSRKPVATLILQELSILAEQSNKAIHGLPFRLIQYEGD